jgi:transcriptional regulator
MARRAYIAAHEDDLHHHRKRPPPPYHPGARRDALIVVRAAGDAPRHGNSGPPGPKAHLRRLPRTGGLPMYVPSHFRLDRAACLAFAQARGFGTVVGFDGARPQASSLPFRLTYAPDGTPRVQFHVARGNPLGALAARGGQWLIAVAGPDAYVSPLWYVSPDQVPTWLYESVQLTGKVRVLSREELRGHLDGLSVHFEPDGKWTFDKVTAGRREMLMQAITGIEMEVETVEGSAKLNQNKSDVDFQAVAMQLRANPDPMAQQIAARMVALRSYLSYETPAFKEETL